MAADSGEKGERETQKSEYLENQKSFLDAIKSIFHHFFNSYHMMSKRKTAHTSFKLGLSRAIIDDSKILRNFMFVGTMSSMIKEVPVFNWFRIFIWILVFIPPCLDMFSLFRIFVLILWLIP